MRARRIDKRLVVSEIKGRLIGAWIDQKFLGNPPITNESAVFSEISEDVKTVRVRLDGVESVLTIESYDFTTEVGAPLFFSAKQYLKENQIPSLIEWSIEGSETSTTLHGFNIAAIWSKPGIFLVRNTYQSFRVRVIDSKQSWTSVLSADLAPIIENAKTALKLSSEVAYFLSRPARVRFPIIGPATIRYTGPEYGGSTSRYRLRLFTLEKNVFVSGLNVNGGVDYSPKADFQTEKHLRPDVFLCLGNNSVSHCSGRNISHISCGENAPSKVLFFNCSTDDSLRRYFWYGPGEELCFDSCKVTDSIFEHGIRIASIGSARPRFVSVNHSTIQNKDKRPEDPINTAKGCIVFQDSEWTYGYNNVCIGPRGIGPLGEGDGLKYPDGRTKYSVSFKESGVMEMKHGAEFIRVALFSGPIRYVPYQPGYTRTIREVVVDGKKVF